MCKQSQQTYENLWATAKHVLVFEKSHLHGQCEETESLELIFHYKFHPLHNTTVWHRQKQHSGQNIECENLYN